MSKDISKEILKYLDFEGGFYIEVGAHNGVFQSNTLKLELEKGWHGLLIEPSPSAFKELMQNRSVFKNIMVNTALVSKDYKEKTIIGDFNGSPMSCVGGIRWGNTIESNIEVPACTLDSILKRHEIKKVDFFSLDVEGYEIEVLEGMDFNWCKPTYFLIEKHKGEYMLFEHMQELGYENLGCLSNFNLVEDPHWDGSHQDYLFKIKENI